MISAHLINSLTEGDFGNGTPLLQSQVEGDFWTRRAGCYTVYRGRDHVEKIDYERIVFTTPSKGSVQLPSFLGHAPETVTYYALRRISSMGKEDRGTRSVVRLSMGADGKQKPAVPNRVRGLRAWGESGGRIRICWWYWPIGQEVSPVHFAVYGDAGSGQIDTTNPMALVPYHGEVFYTTISTPGVDRKAYRFLVRSVGADGSDDGSSGYVEAFVDLTGPESPEGVAGDVSL